MIFKKSSIYKREIVIISKHINLIVNSRSYHHYFVLLGAITIIIETVFLKTFLCCFIMINKFLFHIKMQKK